MLPNLPFIIFVNGSSNKIPTKTSTVRHAKEKIKRLQGGFHFMIRIDKNFPRCKRRLAVRTTVSFQNWSVFHYLLLTARIINAHQTLFTYTQNKCILSSLRFFERTSRTRLNLVSFMVLRGLETAPWIFSCQLLKIQGTLFLSVLFRIPFKDATHAVQNWTNGTI